MSLVARFLIGMAGKAAANRFERATINPAAAQHDKLMQIVEANKNTEYGRKYNFDSIKNIDDWRKLVPVIDYEDIREYMDRIVRGEKNILTAEDPVMFAQTSGTTGDAKYIPVTPTGQGRDHSDQMRTWIYHATKMHPSMFKGQVVSLVSPAIEGYTESGIPFGSTSGHIYKNMPGVVRKTYAIPYEVFLIEDYRAKYYTLMRIGLGSNISFVGTANPSSIIKMCETADKYADELLQDLRDGTLSATLDIDPELRSTIEAVLNRDPARADAFEKAREKRGGKLLPADYWPNLSIIGCWKGGTVGAYIDRFPEWFDPDKTGMVPIRDWGFLSSEARCSIPLSDHGSAGVLTVATNVYEFVPVNEVEENPNDQSKWTYLDPNEVVPGQEYYILFSTVDGLYRYDINDVVEIIGKYNNTPTLVFKRKGRGMTNITGEKLSVNQVIEAFRQTSEAMDVAIDHFKAEADLENSRYVFMVESSALPEEKRLDLLQSLDTRLSELNIEYKSKRASMRLNAPALHIMKAGWYDRKKEELIADGKRIFQAKTVLLDSKEKFKEDSENLEARIQLED